MDPTSGVFSTVNFTTTPSLKTLETKDLQVGQVFHFVFLVFVCLFGTIGNAMTMIAVKIERKLREAVSNYFILNLALADCIVCVIVVPIIMTHTIMGETLLDNVLCYVSAAISGVACHTAAVMMTCIALNRYIAAKRGTTYYQYVTKRRVFLAILLSWIFATANTLPLFLAWLEVNFDPQKYVCVCLDGSFPLKYTLVPVFVGHFLPHAITIYCYARIFKALSASRRRIEKTRMTSSNVTTTFASESHNHKVISTTNVTDEQNSSGEKSKFAVKNWSRHEVQMFKISIWNIIFFSFCWIPYAILVLLQDMPPIELKKGFGALCLLSFTFNPVIYGVLNKSFRRGFKKILNRVFFCLPKSRLPNSNSTVRERFSNQQLSATERSTNAR